jgi:hypothetical protein
MVMIIWIEKTIQVKNNKQNDINNIFAQVPTDDQYSNRY